MAYGTVKVDNITFTNGGIDQTVTVSGIVQSISGNITATGTIQAATIIGTSTVSGATVTGDSGQYGNLNSISGVFTTQLSGATITGDIGQYATLTGISGVFTTAISGATITGDAGNYSELTAISGVFTTQVSGATVTGNAGSFTTVTGGVATITSGVFALGTNALPSISFSSDPNTGIYSPGADQVAISTNGTGRLFIDSSGRVGVGTDAPDGLLTVRPTSGNAQVFIRTNDTTSRSQLIFGDSADSNTGGIQYNHTTDNLEFHVGNLGEKMTLDATGRLGLGTSSPGGMLDAQGSSFVRFSNTSVPTLSNDTHAGEALFIRSGGSAGDNNVQAVLAFGKADGASFRSGAAIGSVQTSADTDQIGLAFYTSTSSASVQTLSEKLRITHAGNVGVGTTSPGALFDLAANNDGATGTTANNTFRFTDLDTNTAADQPIGKIEWYSADTSSPGARAVSYILSAAAGANSGGDIRFGVSANAGTASEAARIDSSGRLLVGTTNSSNNIRLSQKLAIVNANSGSSSHTGLNITNYSNQAGVAPVIDLKKSRSNTDGGTAIVENNDYLGYIVFQGTDGNEFRRAAEISVQVDGTPAYAATALVNGQTYRIVTVGTTDFTLIGASANTVGTVFTATGPGTGTGTAILNAGNMPGRLVFSTTADGASSPTERMRIANNGHTYWGVANPGTTAFGTAIGRLGSPGFFQTARDVNGASEVAFFHGNAGEVRIFGDGDLQNTNNSYTGISDVKLKENIIAAGSQWDDLKALQVRKYNFKTETGYNTHTQIGLVAQEVELVSPGLVSESPDRDEDGNDLGTVTKSVNYSVLYMKAVKALQEAMERIETLETEMAAVKAQLG